MEKGAFCFQHALASLLCLIGGCCWLVGRMAARYSHARGRGRYLDDDMISMEWVDS
jgi:hypothetical protein